MDNTVVLEMVNLLDKRVKGKYWAIVRDGGVSYLSIQSSNGAYKAVEGGVEIIEESVDSALLSAQSA